MGYELDNSFWKDRRVCVTGGAGFLGSFVVEKLRRRGVENIFIPHIEDYDLVKRGDILRLLDDSRPDTIIHLAALQVPFCRADPAQGAAVNVTGTVNVFEISPHGSLNEMEMRPSPSNCARQRGPRSRPPVRRSG